MTASDDRTDRFGHEAAVPKIRMRLVTDFSPSPSFVDPVDSDRSNRQAGPALPDDPGAASAAAEQLLHPGHDPLGLRPARRVGKIGEPGDFRNRQQRVVEAAVAGFCRAQFQPFCFQSRKRLRVPHGRPVLAVVYDQPAGAVRSLRGISPAASGESAMLLNRDEIRQDKTFDMLTEAILERDQPRTADLFFGMVRDGRTVGEALSVVTAAEAPFVQVPSHINVRDGQITLINNDHTILGLRASAHLMPFLPEKYRLLPLLQSVWYIPAGLDIWNQLAGKYPGRYATMKGFNVPPPSYGPVVWQENQEPIRERGTVQERLHQHMIATVSGDSRRSYGLFLGLAEDEGVRPLLIDQLQYLGLIDLQDTVIGRKARNTGHKAIRARAITDLADFIGWERSHGVYYMGVPDMAIGPLYYSLYDAVCVRMNSEFPDGGASLEQTNQTPLSPAEVEEMVRQLMEADADTVWNLLTAHLKNGKSIRSLGDTIQIGAAELILRTTVPRQFTNGQHPFDYCNVANNWMRTSDN